MTDAVAVHSFGDSFESHVEWCVVMAVVNLEYWRSDLGYAYPTVTVFEAFVTLERVYLANSKAFQRHRKVLVVPLQCLVIHLVVVENDC